MLLLSLFLGAGVAGSFHLPFVFLSLSAIALFSSLYSLGEGTKRVSTGRDMRREALSSFIYLLLSILFVAPLFLVYHIWSLLALSLLVAPFFFIYLYLIFRRKHRTPWAEMVNITGISFPAAASYFISAGAWSNTALLLWLLTFLYSASSVFYVRLKVRQKAPYRAGFNQRLSSGKGLLVYLAAMFVALIILAIAGAIQFLLFAAYLPLALKALFAIFYSRGVTSIKIVGFTEVGYTLLFGILFIIIFE